MRLVRLLVGIIALSGIFADAQMPRAEVADCAGVVVDDNGVPVPSAEVTLKDAAGHSYRTETDAAGRFAFHNLSSGDYQAEARKAGLFLLAVQAVALHAGGNESSLLLHYQQVGHERVE